MILERAKNEISRENGNAKNRLSHNVENYTRCEVVYIVVVSASYYDLQVSSNLLSLGGDRQRNLLQVQLMHNSNIFQHLSNFVWSLLGLPRAPQDLGNEPRHNA